MSTDPSARPAPEDPLEELVAEALERFEASGPQAVEALLAAHPERAAELRRRLGALLDLGLLAGPGPGQPRDLPERIGDFRLGARLGGGGMGVVHLARQETLGRDVALKLVRPELLLFGDARQRFRREVQAVARLQHPGIVQVFAVGEHQGLPWFAMEYAHGATLAEILEALRGRRPAELGAADLAATLQRLCDRRAEAIGWRAPAASRSTSSASGAVDPRSATSWPAAVARILEQAALAVQHAHEQGILHRDIKPSNLLLTQGGRVLLFDFGLASEQGSERITATGCRVGSLAYMAPEQLDGRADERSDVYGLGATLYECLTLELPYAASSGEALAQHIRSGDAIPPRRRSPGLPRDLETIVLTALDRDPERRYRRPLDLAEDLRRLLALQPISARRPGPWPRLRRLAARSPALTTALCLGLVAALLAPAISGHFERQRSRALASASARAEQNLVATLRSVGSLLVRVGDGALRETPGTAAAQEALLDEAMRFLEGVETESPEDPRLIGSQVLVWTKRAQLLQREGRWAELRGSVDRGLELSARWVAARPQDPDAWLARYHLLAAGESGAGEERDAERAAALLAELLVSAEKRCALAPEDLNSALGLAGALDRQASGEARAGGLEAASERWALAERQLQPWVERRPDSAAARGQLYAVLNNHGEALRAAGRDPQALPLLERAARLLAEDEAHWRQDTELFADLLVTHSNLAGLLLSLGRPREALEAVAGWTQAADERLARFPERVLLERAVAFFHNRCGAALLALGDHGQALARAERALSISRRALEREASDRRGKLDLALALSLRSAALQRAGQPAEGLESALDGLDLLAGLAQLAPEDLHLARELHLLAGQGAESLGFGAMLAQLAESMAAALGQNPADLRRAGGMQARVLALIEAQADLDPATREELREQHLARCLEWLTAAARAGALVREELETAPDFAALRTRPDFPELVERLLGGR